MSRAVENAASVEIRAKERARISHERLGKSSAKNARFYHIYHSADGGLISHSSLLFFFSISSWTYYKATRWPSSWLQAPSPLSPRSISLYKLPRASKRRTRKA